MDDLRRHLQRTLDGNKNAFSEVVTLFQDMAMSLAMRNLGNHALAEETVQESFAQAYFKLHLLKDVNAFPGWFRTILIRHCMLARKRNGNHVSLEEERALEADAMHCDPHTVFTRHLDREQVRSLLQGLTNPYREACMQRYIMGRSYKEISRDLDLPVGTVKRRLYVVREKIIKKFNKIKSSGIRVGYMPISDHLLIMAAHHLHNGKVFDIHPRKYLSWGSLVQALNSEILDAALIMAPLAMSLHASGMPIRYVLDCHHDGSAVTVRNGGGHSTRSCPKMALPHQISTHHLLLRLLFGQANEEGHTPLYPNDVATQFISPSYVIGSLLQRKIDGFFCSEPWSTKSVAQGVGKILARSKDLIPGHSCCILVVRESFAKEKSDMLDSFLDLLEKTGEHLACHPLEGARVLTHYTGVDLGIAEHVLCEKHITFTNLRPDEKRTGELMHLARETGVLKKPCDLAAFMGS